MFEIGRVIIKLSGRDGGELGVIVSKEGNMVLIDGNVRRRKVNVKHVEPTSKLLKIKKNASHNDVVKVMKEAKLGIKEKRGKKAKKSKKPIKKRILKGLEKKKEVKKKVKEFKKEPSKKEK